MLKGWIVAMGVAIILVAVFATILSVYSMVMYVADLRLLLPLQGN
jgi:hypothetical protein